MVLVSLWFSLINATASMTQHIRTSIIAKVGGIDCTFFECLHVVLLVSVSISCALISQVVIDDARDGVHPVDIDTVSSSKDIDTVSSSPLMFLLYKLMFIPGMYGGIFIHYSVVAWLGLSFLGAAFGVILSSYSKQRLCAVMLPTGITCLLLFCGVRSGDAFGNTHMIIAIGNGSGADTVIRFLNVTKYPPSLAYSLLYGGINLVCLSLILGSKRENFLPFVIFGRVPLFIYMLHLFVYGILGAALWPVSCPSGLDAPWYFVVWLVGLAIMYPACRCFTSFKNRTETTSFWRLC